MNDEQRTELRRSLRGDSADPVIPFAQPQIFPTMPVSLVWLYLPVVIAGVLLIVQTLATLLLSLKGDSAGKETPC